jgi:hypothetical protein
VRAQAGLPGMGAVGQGDGLVQPFPLVVGEQGQYRGEVGLVLGAGVLGLVEQLDVRGDVGDALAGDAAEGVDGAPDSVVAPGDPAGAVGLVEHHLDLPGVVRAGAAPDVVDAGGRGLAGEPGA